MFGNSKLRERTAEYVDAKARSLLKDLAKESPLLEGMLSLDLLKMKQKDQVEDCIRSWYLQVDFDIDRQWESRLRRYYAERYDVRNNLIDWDVHMKLEPRGASVVHPLLYRTWRNTGIAFEIRQSSYPQPNRTLASYTSGTEQGNLIQRRGYWGDIVASPFLSWGIDSEDVKLFEKRNQQHTHHCGQIAEINLMHVLHECEHSTKYSAAQDIVSPNAEQSAVPLADVGKMGDTADTAQRVATREICLPQDVKIHFVLGKTRDLMGKKRFEGLFDVVSIGVLATQQEFSRTCLRKDSIQCI